MTDTNPGPTGPPPPPPPPAHRPLARSSSNRVIAGVCGGLAEHFQIDPVIVRIAFVLVTFFGGFGLLLYVAMWFLLPQSSGAVQTGPAPLTRLRLRNGRTLVAVILIVVAVFAFADGFNIDHRGIIWGLVLVGLGIFLLVQEGWQPAPYHPTGPRGPSAGYAAASFSPAPASYPIAASPSAQAWTAAATAPAERSILGLVTVAAALLAIGVASLLDSAGLVSVSFATGSAIVLLVVAAGLLAGTWFGRSRALIVLGVLLIPFTAAATLVREPLAGGTGNVTVSPQRLANVQGEYHLVAGKLTVDLSQVVVGSGSQNVTATVAFGQLTVVVPAGVNLDVHGHVGAGEVNLLGAYDNGVNIDSAVTEEPSATTGTLHLYLSTGFGRVEVINTPDTGAALPQPAVIH